MHGHFLYLKRIIKQKNVSVVLMNTLTNGPFSVLSLRPRIWAFEYFVNCFGRLGHNSFAIFAAGLYLHF